MKSLLLFIGTEQILVLVVFVVIFFAVRAVMLWYWKIDVIVMNQQKQIDLLTELIKQKSKIGESTLSDDEILEKARRYDEMSKR